MALAEEAALASAAVRDDGFLRAYVRRRLVRVVDLSHPQLHGLTLRRLRLRDRLALAWRLIRGK